jgi:transposase
LAPFLPAAAGCGRLPAYAMREIVNAITYVLRGGIVWRSMPASFPPWGTVYRWFTRLRDYGTWETINHHLVMRDRERTGRQASPTAAVVDIQSVKTTESGGVRGFDAGKKIKGRQRHAMVSPTAGRSSFRPTPPISRTVTGPGRCCAPHARTGRLSSWPMLTQAIRVYAWRRQSRSGWRSYTRPRARLGLRCMRAAGWSNVSSPGPTATAVSPRTSRRQSHQRKRSSKRPPLSSRYADWHADRTIQSRREDNYSKFSTSVR